jgi:23S rRNA G2445 N2-methylase RlmL
MNAPSSRGYFMTVPTGFEFLAREELQEALGDHHCDSRRGKLLIDTAAPIDQLLHLRACFHVYARITCREDLPLDETGPAWLTALCAELDFQQALNTWAACFDREGEPCSFRITAQRSGEQAYSSQQAAAALGAGVQRRFGWPVDLNNPDVEVYAHLRDNELLIGLTLTPTGLHYADQLERGRTGLKQPIAHGLARLARLQAGEITLDPMCGVGTLPIEAAALQPNATHIAGDQHRSELQRAWRNRQRTAKRFALLQWDARQLPLADASIDAILCDLPFGVRVGSHRRNVHLYPPVFDEMARVLKPGGRAVLLSLERRLVQRRVEKDRRWTCEARHPVHYGGLDPAAYVLRRGEDPRKTSH